MKSQTSMPIIILCGGKGVLSDEGRRIPKGLLRVQGATLLHHLVRSYVRQGWKRFYLAVGSHEALFAEEIQSWNWGHGEASSVSTTIVPTGEETGTWGRVLKVVPSLGDCETFGVTYSDTLSNVDLKAEVEFHLSQGKLATLLGARLPTRFKVLGMRYGDPLVRGFSTQSVLQQDWINGGFYFFQRRVLDLINPRQANSSVLEVDLLDELVKLNQLVAYQPDGTWWQHMDSERDLRQLELLLMKTSDC